MRNLKKFAVAVAAAGALAVSLPAPAFAINTVACGNRTDLFKLVAVSASVCFANKGKMDVDISDVLDFSTGNNDVTISFVTHGNVGHVINVGRNQSLSAMPNRQFIPQIVRVYRVEIH